jgi:RNA polymerase sigma-70 factor (ECF subfamily)
MLANDSETDQLIERAAGGEAAARDELLARHRARLRHMVSVRMDRRLAARMDPSDVVQEALAEANRCLPDYLRDRPLPFYPWLRRLAWERLVAAARRHLLACRRSVAREQPGAVVLSDESLFTLANRLASSATSPSGRLRRAELRQRVRAALAELDEQDREVLVLRYLEQLSTRETAAVLGVSEGGVKSRLMRAIVRLRLRLEHESEFRP